MPLRKTFEEVRKMIETESETRNPQILHMYSEAARQNKNMSHIELVRFGELRITWQVNYSDDDINYKFISEP